MGGERAHDFGPTLVTQRLILRPPRLEDFDAFAEMMADPDGLVFIGGAQPKAVAWRTFATLRGAWALTGEAMFLVFARDDGRLLGRIGPNHPWGWPGTEVGWGLVRSAWGQGFALEAARASMDFAVDRLGWRDIVHCIDPANTPSIALARRLGSTNRGPARMPEPYQDRAIDLWGQTADAWRGRRRAG